MDLSIDADLRTMIMVWMGDLPLHRALRSGAITADGPRPLVRGFPAWLQLNLLARVERPVAGDQVAGGPVV